MSTAFVVSIAVPLAVGAICLVARSHLPKFAADSRGIALQTVIIMVVLLAIAGGVAAALLATGGDAVTDLENQDIAREASDYDNETLCDAAGFTWDGTNNTCG